MRLLMLCLLVSLAALLAAAGAIVRHVWVHHFKLRSQAISRIDAIQESDIEH